MPHRHHPPEPQILVVDQDVRAARVLVKMLREDGFHVELASDGKEALDRVAKAPTPSALITDLWMPGAGGLALAKSAREARAEIPIFLVTSHPQPVTQVQLPVGPPPVVMTKPVDYEALVSALKQVMPHPLRRRGRERAA